MKLYKVLNKDLVSPYQEFKFEIGVKYHCKDFDTDKTMDCSRGFYAVDVDGLPYAFNTKKEIYLVEVYGKSVEINQYKRRYEYIKIIRKCTKEEIIKVAKKKERELGYKLSEILYPTIPLAKKRKPAKKDIDNLKKWASVRASLGASVWDSVGASLGASVGASVWDSVWASVGASVWASLGASVRASVGASVGAYISSLFPNIKQWKYIEHKEGVNPYQPAIDLWHRGLVPSFDGKTWRLHSGKKAEVVYEYIPGGEE